MCFSYTIDNFILIIGQVRVGMSIGHSPGEEPHIPDMKKDEKNITDAEREEAKRRIGGSLSTGNDPETMVPGEQ